MANTIRSPHNTLIIRFGIPVIIAVFLIPIVTPNSAQADGNQPPILRSPSSFVSFLEKSILKVPATRAIESGDLNGDEATDLIFVTPDPQVFWYCLGDGKGGFAPPQKQGFGSGYSDVVISSTFIVGDFNGDGKEELVNFQRRRISSEGSEANLYLVSSELGSDDTLTEGLAFPVFVGDMTMSPNQLLLFSRDTDTDGKADFVFGDIISDRFFFVHNNSELWGASTFNFDSVIGINVGTGSKSMRNPLFALTLDVDNDGLTDILKVGEREMFLIRGDEETIFVNQGNTASTAFFAYPHGGSIGHDTIILHGMLNRDEFPDLVFIMGEGRSSLLLNRAGEGFGLFISLDLSGTPLVALGDFNGDGIDDLVAGGGGYKGIKILLNGGIGGFGRVVERPLGGAVIYNLQVCDLNDDGLSDIICTLKGPFGGLQGRVLLNISQRIEQ